MVRILPDRAVTLKYLREAKGCSEVQSTARFKQIFVEIFSVDSTLAKKKNILIDIWNNAFKLVQGQLSKLLVSTCGSQSWRKLNSYFQFIKSTSYGDTDQFLQRSAADMLIFPLKNPLLTVGVCKCWWWLAPCRMHLLKLPQQISVWRIFACIVL